MIHKIIKPFLNYLYINSFTIKDLGATELLKLPKIIKKNNTMTVLTLQDQDKFIHSLDGNPDRMLYLFALRYRIAFRRDIGTYIERCK
ncbi:protein of unknown function [Clostridium beijerinckii]|nr:protein of unknown function [Clostridium beijerinckii]